MVRTANSAMSPCQTQSTNSVTRKYPMTHRVCGSNLPGSLSLDVCFLMERSVSTPLAGFYQDVVAAALTPHAQEHALLFDLVTQFDGLIGAGNRFAVDLQDHIAGLQAGRSRRRARVHVYHQRATAHLVGDVQLSARGRVEIGHLNAVERITLGARAPSARPPGFGQA